MGHRIISPMSKGAKGARRFGARNFYPLGLRDRRGGQCQFEDVSVRRSCLVSKRHGGLVARNVVEWGGDLFAIQVNSRRSAWPTRLGMKTQNPAALRQCSLEVSLGRADFHGHAGLLFVR